MAVYIFDSIDITMQVPVQGKDGYDLSQPLRGGFVNMLQPSM